MCCVHIQDRLLKPLAGFAGYSSEMRELAGVISRVSKFLLNLSLSLSPFPKHTHMRYDMVGVFLSLVFFNDFLGAVAHLPVHKP